MCSCLVLSCSCAVCVLYRLHLVWITRPCHYTSCWIPCRLVTSIRRRFNPRLARYIYSQINVMGAGRSRAVPDIKPTGRLGAIETVRAVRAGFGFSWRENTALQHNRACSGVLLPSLAKWWDIGSTTLADYTQPIIPTTWAIGRYLSICYGLCHLARCVLKPSPCIGIQVHGRSTGPRTPLDTLSAPIERPVTGQRWVEWWTVLAARTRYHRRSS